MSCLHCFTHNSGANLPLGFYADVVNSDRVHIRVEEGGRKTREIIEAVQEKKRQTSYHHVVYKKRRRRTMITIWPATRRNIKKKIALQ